MAQNGNNDPLGDNDYVLLLGPDSLPIPLEPRGTQHVIPLGHLDKATLVAHNATNNGSNHGSHLGYVHGSHLENIDRNNCVQENL